MKTYADKRRHAITSNFRVGDRVIYHQLNSKINNKYKNQFSNISYIIKVVKGSMITVIDSNNNELTHIFTHLIITTIYQQELQTTITLLTKIYNNIILKQ
jgi:hypothetical protein